MGGRTCFDVHHCDFDYPPKHPSVPSEVRSGASPFSSILQSPAVIRSKSQSVDDDDGNDNDEYSSM